MDWKRDLDALIESTMAFVKDFKREPIPDLSTVEQALADTSKPDLSRAVMPIVRPTSERDEIRQRISNFKAHQEKMAREREDYYLQVKAKMLAPVDPRPSQLGQLPALVGDSFTANVSPFEHGPFRRRQR
jgi:hypothetical protein